MSEKDNQEEKQESDKATIGYKLKHLPSKYKSLIITMLLDIVFSLAAYFLSRLTMFYDPSVIMPEGYITFEPIVVIVTLVVTISMLIFFDCYNTVWKYAGRVEFLKILFAYFASFATLMLFKVVVDFAFEVRIWAPVFILYIMFSGILSIGMRFIYVVRSYFKHVKNLVDDNSQRLKRTIVIGAGYTGTLAINRFITNPHEGYFPVALIDDDPEKQGRKVYGIMVEGGLDCLESAIKKYSADMLVIAIMSLTKSRLKDIYTYCAAFNLPIKIVPAMTDADSMAHENISLRDIKIEELLGRDEFKIRHDLIDCAVKDKIVMVTGGAGSIGSELCRQALSFGCKHLIIFDMHENGMFDLNNELLKKYDSSRYTLVMGTVRERPKLKEVFSKYKPQVVFHAAAYKHVPMMEISATEAIKNNVFGTLNVVNECIESNAEKFVFISTDKAVNPANVMGASKRIAEIMIQSVGKKSKLKMAAVRFGNVLGSNGSVIPIFLKQIAEGGPITVTDRNIKRYFMTIPEAVRLVLQTGALANSGEVFVLDMGDPVYIYDLACDLIRINGLIPEKDIKIEITGLRPGEKLFEELRYDKETVNNTIHEGIFVTRLSNSDADDIENKLTRLYKAAAAEDELGTIRHIFEIVPDTFRNMALEEQIHSKEFERQGVRAVNKNIDTVKTEDLQDVLTETQTDEDENAQAAEKGGS